MAIEAARTIPLAKWDFSDDFYRCYSNREPVCPYCNHVYRDAWDLQLDEDETAEIECGKCERQFEIQKLVAITYSTKPLIELAGAGGASDE